MYHMAHTPFYISDESLIKTFMMRSPEWASCPSFCRQILSSFLYFMPRRMSLVPGGKPNTVFYWMVKHCVEIWWICLAWTLWTSCTFLTRKLLPVAEMFGPLPWPKLGFHPVCWASPVGIQCIYVHHHLLVTCIYKCLTFFYTKLCLTWT